MINNTLNFISSVLRYLVSGSFLILTWSASLYGQQAKISDTTPSGGESGTLLQTVYEQTISQLRDSLFLAREREEAAVFQVDQVESQLTAREDSLGFYRTAAEGLADSLSRLFILYDRIRIENEQNRQRLGIVIDSLSVAKRRGNAITRRIDSLETAIDQNRDFLDRAGSTESIYRDSIAVLRKNVGELERELVATEARMGSLYDQLKNAIVSPEDPSYSREDEQKLYTYLGYLQDYEIKGGGIAGIFKFKGNENKGVLDYQLGEIRNYFSRFALRGQAAEVLNIQADIYVKNGDDSRGVLAYLKTVFLFPESEAGLEARTRAQELAAEDPELAGLYELLSLSEDSLQIEGEEFYRYLNYLDHIRALASETALRWFIDDANLFMLIYPGILQGDQILLWISEAYHRLGEYHNELLLFKKIRTVFPESVLLPEVVYATAEVTAHDLGEDQQGADLYAEFVAGYPDHEQAPSALFTQAEINRDKLKNYQGAADLFRRLADQFPDDDLARLSLFQVGELMAGRLASPTGALATYQEVVDRYGDSPDDAIPALTRLGQLSGDMRQFDAAVVYYLNIYERYPQDQRAIDAIISAADIYQSKLDNLDAAISTLQLVVDNYPDYGDLRSITKNIQKLEKKRKG